MIRVVFLGTPEFAIPTLRALLAHPEVEVAGVITQPDRPAGRGRRLTPPLIKEVAAAAGVPVWQFERIRRQPEALAVLDDLRPDLGVVVAFGQILPPSFFERPPLGMLNVHASILPRYRGAAPIVHALVEGETETGVSIMRIDAGMDTGDVLKVCPVPISLETNAGELEEILARLGAEALLSCVFDYARGTLRPVPQSSDAATLAPMIRREDTRIDWSQSARRIHNRIRAMNPAPGAFCTWREQELKIWRSLSDHPVWDHSGKAAPPGTVLSVDGGRIGVLCGDGCCLHLVELQAPGRRRLPAADFVNGMRLVPGERFA